MFLLQVLGVFCDLGLAALLWGTYNPVLGFPRYWFNATALVKIK
jgi:hypothetical protein